MIFMIFMINVSGKAHVLRIGRAQAPVLEKIEGTQNLLFSTFSGILNIKYHLATLFLSEAYWMPSRTAAGGADAEFCNATA